jgi:hypothetical protein
MAELRRQEMRAVVVLGMMVLGFGFTAQRAWATDTPGDPCSLLTAGQVSSTLGDKYGAPEKSVAPRPFANTVQGTDCQYKTASGQDQVLFRVYFDASAAQATDLHARLKMFFGKDSTPASVGDEAYVDKNAAIHVRKGNVRYFLAISHGDTPTGRKQILALAALVAGEL